MGLVWDSSLGTLEITNSGKNPRNDQDNEDLFEGFPLRLPENIGWSKQDFQHNIPDFTL